MKNEELVGDPFHLFPAAVKMSNPPGNTGGTAVKKVKKVSNASCETDRKTVR
jgi:hypothetical protein